MDSLRIITTKEGETYQEGLVAINTGLQGTPILEYYTSGRWIPLDNLSTTERMARLDDLYTHLYLRGWGIGPRFSTKDGELYIHTDLKDSPVPELSGGIRISGYNTTDDLTEDMNKEIDIYYDALVSARDFLEGSSVVDLWEYPTEYGGTLNLSTLPLPKDHLRYTGTSPIITLGLAWTVGGIRKTRNFTFTPWTIGNEDGGDFEWNNFQAPLSEITLEVQDGRIRVFPGSPEVTECLIHHCTATYDGLL